MMTKYQIVFTKLEVTVCNIIRTTEFKKKNRIKKAFFKFLENSQLEKERYKQKCELVCITFESKLKAMVACFSKFESKRKLAIMFQIWHQKTKLKDIETQAKTKMETKFKSINS